MEPVEIECKECKTKVTIRQILPFGWIRVLYSYYCRACAILFDIDPREK